MHSVVEITPAAELADFPEGNGVVVRVGETLTEETEILTPAAEEVAVDSVHSLVDRTPSAELVEWSEAAVAPV